MNEKLVSRTQSFIEANIDYQVFFDNIFTVSTAAEKAQQGAQRSLRKLTSSLILNTDGEADISKSIALRRSLTKQVQSRIVKQLLCLCSTLYEKPVIFAQKNSVMTHKVG